VTTSIDPGQTLGALVAERPALTGTLEQLRLDYCCGGGQTLAEACRRGGLDPDTVAVLLERLGETAAAGRVEPHDLRGATIAELCDHIVDAHHARLRRELPRIEELLATVVRVHGPEHAELHDLERLFATLARELREHLASEEASVFPAARAFQAGEHADPGFVELVDEHIGEHADTGDALAALRELAGGYERASAYCGTHRSLLEALEAFELDLHQHVHEENNVLFPRLLEHAGGRAA
jgi:regulator of cell morphogenesis and NO signaling